MRAEVPDTSLEVTLHVIHGYLHELEIWDWTRDPADIPVPSPGELEYASW